MIQQDEKILFVSNAQVVAIIKQNMSLNTGFIQKKVVLTTRRCLMFESLSNKIQDLQYQIVARKVMPAKNQKDPKGQPIKQRKSRVSINSYPQFWFYANQRDAKVAIDQQPNIMKYFAKVGVKNLVKSTTGMVLLKNVKKQKFQVLLFPGLKQSFRFIKGLICAKAWLLYEKHCIQRKIDPTLKWVRILQQIVTHENSLTLIDPDLFQSGSSLQIQSFFKLITQIPFAHSFQLRYAIVNQESMTYTLDFIKVLQERIHLLNLSKTSLDSQNLVRLLTSNVRTRNLMKLNLQHNQLTDRCFNGLQMFARQNKKLSYINLAYNQITLSNFSSLLQFLKVTPIILNLNLSYNKITDRAVEQIQKFIIFALNPPIQQIDLSFNEFTMKGAWRLYVGFLKNFKNHIYLNFIVYPIPFKKQIFTEMEVDFPRKQKQINFNMHSALIQQFQQQSMMKHTMIDFLVPGDTITIRFIRQLLPHVRLPKNKQQVSKTLDLSNQIQNFIYSTQTVQRIYDIAVKMKNFPFQVPPRTRNNFVMYMNKKLNQALLIRDHYSIKYILKSMKLLQIPHHGYADRLQRVQFRDKILAKRLQNLLQFRHHEISINKQIDELVKQSLRLYLQGRGIQLLYYLKFSRDQIIERLLQQKYNPQHELYGKMAQRNLSNDQRVTSKDFIIPYQIKIQKRINQNFYLHPWQTNYLILSQLTPKIFNECLQFLEQSQKRQTFAKYFQRIQERVEFIKNQFALFRYKLFKVSYTDLKVNACRLLFLYKNIQDTHFFLEIPIYIKKKPITRQKQIAVYNKQLFLKKYHIVNYPNINYEAKKAHFYNYQKTITRYQSEVFDTEVKKVLNILNDKIFLMIRKYIHANKPKEEMIDIVLVYIKQIIDIVRHSIYPEELKQQIYLHFIGWRHGKKGGNSQVIQLIPWLTMYLKPPIQIQKYLVAAILESKRQQIQKFPLCIVSDVNKPTPQDILRYESQFVERDWMPPDYILSELILNNGKVTIEIMLLDKKKISVKVAQSTNISQLVSYVMGYHQLSCEDRQCFWLYKLDKETQQTTPLTGSDYLGQIISNMIPESQLFICRRRIYSRQMKYVFTRYGQSIIDSIYSEVKFDYMMRGLYDNEKNIYQVSSLLFIIDNLENFQIFQKKDPLYKNKKIDQFILDQATRIQSVYPAYIPRQIMARIMKDKEAIFNQIKAKISQRMLKNQHLAVYQMKTSFIRHFQQFPQFCSTNYKMMDKNSNQVKVFINCMYVFIEAQNQKQYIKLQKIISIIPKAKYVILSYHKNQNMVGQVPLFSEEVNILAISMDILTYCLMRLKMVSSNLYQINKYQRITQQIIELQKSLKKVYQRSLDDKLIKNRQQKQNLKAKIMKMSLTLMDLKQLIYFNQSKYIKSFLDRKLYANKTQKKMAYSLQMDEEQARQSQIWNRNIFKTVFPQYNEKYGYQPENQDVHIGMGSNNNFNNTNNAGDQYNEDSQYDVDFYNEPADKKKDNDDLQKSPQQPTQKKGVKPLQLNTKNKQPQDYNSTNKKPGQQQPSKAPQQDIFAKLLGQKQSQPVQQKPQPTQPPLNEQQDVVNIKKPVGGRKIPPRRQR